jgi:uncharacterized protein (TIGR02246 family)
MEPTHVGCYFLNGLLRGKAQHPRSNMNSIQFLALAASLLVVVGCQSSTQSRTQRQPSASQQEEELRQASTEWDRSFNSGDAAKLASLYAELAISMPPNNPTLQGRKALQADFESFFAANIARHQTTVDKIEMDRDLAIEAAHYRLSYRPRAGGAEVVESGRHLECRRKIDGQWRIVLEIWNSETPPPK